MNDDEKNEYENGKNICKKRRKDEINFHPINTEEKITIIVMEL